MSEGEKVEDKKADVIDPAQFAALQSQFVALQAQLVEYSESNAKLQTNNRALMEEKVIAKKEVIKANQEAMKKSGDVEALDKSWKDKLDAEINSREERLKKNSVDIHRLIVGSAAMKLSNEIALTGSASVLYPHLVSRMSYEDKDDVPTLRILDKSGKPSALTEDDLKKEFQADPAFAPLMIGSKANGSGPAGNKSQINGSGTTMLRSVWNKLDHVPRKEFLDKHGSKGLVDD